MGGGGGGWWVVGGGVDSKQTQQIQISVPTQLEGSVEAVYVAAMLEGRKQGACCASYLLTVDSRTSTNNLYSIINNTAWANPLYVSGPACFKTYKMTLLWSKIHLIFNVNLWLMHQKTIYKLLTRVPSPSRISDCANGFNFKPFNAKDEMFSYWSDVLAYVMLEFQVSTSRLWVMYRIGLQTSCDVTKSCSYVGTLKSDLIAFWSNVKAKVSLNRRGTFKFTFYAEHLHQEASRSLLWCKRSAVL